MPAVVGSGAAVFDFDSDGRMDILLLQNGGPESLSINRLFQQGADHTFSDVSSGSGLDVAGFGMGVAVGDVNNDGFPDVLITEYGGVRLFLNINGDGVFKDVTRDAGLDNPLWGTSAAYLDYDRDGWLDLAVVNYVDYDAEKSCLGKSGRREFCGPASFEGTVTRLYRNLGPLTTATENTVAFEDMTANSGLAAAKGPGLGVVCADFNADGWSDILVANDGKANHLWINQHEGRFEDHAILYGLGYNGAGHTQANMGVAVGDVDGDGLFDVFITHLPGEQNVCWKQQSKGVFQDRTTQMQLANPLWNGTGFGTILEDFDLDGDIDIAVANGAVRVPELVSTPGSDPFFGRYCERNQLFANDGEGRFNDVSEGDPFCGQPAVSRGLACGDIFGDGGLCLLVTRVGMSARLYRYDAPRRGHWMLVRAVDPALGGRDAYGAEVEIKAGERHWHRWVNPGSSFLCSNDPRTHFGLGPTEEIDLIRIIWPDGLVERFDGRATDQSIVLKKGSGTLDQ